MILDRKIQKCHNKCRVCFFCLSKVKSNKTSLDHINSIRYFDFFVKICYGKCSTWWLGVATGILNPKFINFWNYFMQHKQWYECVIQKSVIQQH